MHTDSTADTTAARVSPRGPHAPPAQFKTVRASSPPSETGRRARAWPESDAAPPAKGVEKKLTRLPAASREEQLERWGLDGSARWAGVERNDYGSPDDAADADFLRGGGWHVVDPEHDGLDSGMTAHRGVLQADEHVDTDVLLLAVEQELGFTLNELCSVYSTGGRIPDHLRELRGRLDARLLALSLAGGNMDLFSRVTGLAPATLDRALVRAKAAQ